MYCKLPRLFFSILHSAIATLLLAGLAADGIAQAQAITSAGQPAELAIRTAGDASLRVTLTPIGKEDDIPPSPVLGDREYPEPAIRLRDIDEAVEEQVGEFKVTVTSAPLAVRVDNSDGELVQEIAFQDDGSVTFALDDQPVLGMGEGGPRPRRRANWRTEPIEFDRRGRFHRMQPRWQSDAYGSRNPVALLVGTKGWGLFVAAPWGAIDLSSEDRGRLIPIERPDPDSTPQNQRDQQENRGKGIPPAEALVPGYYDLFVFDARDPAAFMQDVASISGAAVLPPKWSLGYMQSHRTLEDDAQLVDIVETFREKQIPVDAVIYLGTGFTPRGWNTRQPSFRFNPEVFERSPEEVIEDLHENNVKVIVHMVPYDRDRLPTLYGSIPPAEGESVDEGHIAPYWQEHEPLVEAGIDAWWPDEGDWFDLYERMKRHQLYYVGPLSTQPNVRPWSLHRNGHLGIARWGGWVWSGDTQSTWKTLEGQIAVGINHSLSLSPYWGSDIGGFYPTEELTGELYTRWFQFGSFCPSFRSHGRTWWTRLPWGWGRNERGPLENRTPPRQSAMNDPTVEPVVKKYAELRYQLLPYTYTLAWQARETGLPLMRAMWLHYPDDEQARGLGNQYLWGRDMLVAPVFEQGATERDVYLPEGSWYDWWTNEKHDGPATITREVDLSIMPLFVRAGAILPVDPVRQYSSEPVDEPMTLRIYRGADGDFTLYEDDGVSLDYIDGESTRTRMTWDDATSTLTIEPDGDGANASERTFRVQLVPEGTSRDVTYAGERIEVTF